MACDGCGCGHRGADKVCAPALALPSFKVTVARRSATLSALKYVRVHPQTHGAAGLAPLEPCFKKEPVKSFPFGFKLNGLRAGHDHRLHTAIDAIAFDNSR